MKKNYLSIKSSVLLALFFIFAIQVYAQQNYNIADFVNPNYRYHSLDFTLNLNSSNSLGRYESDNSDLFKSNYSNLNLNLNAAYYQIKNTVRYQGTQYISVYTQGTLNNNLNELTLQTVYYDAHSKYRNINLQLNYSSSNRFYKTKKQFLEIIPAVNLNFQNSRTINDMTPVNYPLNSKTIGNSNYLNFGLSVMLGVGRIENIENARLALYIINDLQKRGNIKKNLSNDQVKQLADFITILRNKRFFDSRLQNIAQITAVDSLLTAMGIREHANAGYFMILNDDWNYANGPVRQSGQRFAFGLTPGYSYDLSKSTRETVVNPSSPATLTTSSEKTDLTSLEFSAYYYIEKPVNLTWQHSTRIRVGYQLRKQEYKYLTDQVQNYKNSLNYPNLNFALERIYGYYPNSRTNLILDLKSGGLYVTEKPDGSVDVKNKEFSLFASVFLRGNYYFSPRLRLNLNVGVNYNYQHFENNMGTPQQTAEYTHLWSPELSLNLRYSIF
ncbi:MAG: hypothetical protein JXR65_10890 [Bacteroidales bacterium]|nr:hypothetical protein [Bacteroidales bacterium]